MNNAPTLKDISDKSIITSLKELIKNESELIAEVVLHLSEVYTRRLYLSEGYSSLFNYCVKGLGYSEGASCRRIEAAKALKANPEIYSLLKERKLSLCTVSEISKVERQEDKSLVIEASKGKSKSEVQKITATFSSTVKGVKKERIVPKKTIQEEPSLFTYNKDEAPREELSYAVSLDFDNELMKLYEEAKRLVGQVPMAVVFKRSLREFIERRKTVYRKSEYKAPSNSRYIPKGVKLELIKRDGCQCSYVSKDGRRCEEDTGLEVDHIMPFGIGGTNSVDNLRLLCPAHNRFLAEITFGRDKMARFNNKGLKENAGEVVNLR